MRYCLFINAKINIIVRGTESVSACSVGSPRSAACRPPQWISDINLVARISKATLSLSLVSGRHQGNFGCLEGRFPVRNLLGFSGQFAFASPARPCNAVARSQYLRRTSRWFRTRSSMFSYTIWGGWSLFCTISSKRNLKIQLIMFDRLRNVLSRFQHPSFYAQRSFLSK